MRVLILGAGATGGYFGARLVEGGVDVSFLVRPRRAAQLAAEGLAVVSPLGDIRSAVTTVMADSLNGAYDLVILSCKAYDLEAAIAAVRPAVGPATVVLPLLNGLRHMARLDEAFGAERVLGGLCHIAATLGPEGEIRHLNKLHFLAFGERAGGASARGEAIATTLRRGRFELKLSDDITQDMWEKLVMLATLASLTCLMRATVGNIMAARDGAAIAREMLDECRAVAAASGRPPRPHFLERTAASLTQRDSPMTASMLRDIERGGSIEADHIVGDLLDRAHALGVATPLLRVAYCHLQAYEAARSGRQ